jgi:isopenicillin N synthase-like dioxygenase
LDLIEYLYAPVKNLSFKMTESSPDLPILSLPTLSTPQGLAALSAACQETGFFHLIDHGIPASQLNRLLDLTRTFFQTASPAEKTKLARGKGGDMARGYQQIGENITLGKRDVHEAIDFYAPWEMDRLQNGIVDATLMEEARGVVTGKNLWPQTPYELRGELEEHIEQANQVGSQIVKAMGLALGLSDLERRELEYGMDKGFWVCRIIGYPQLPDGNEGISCGQHTDYGALTLLLATPTSPPSLQVLHRPTDTWIPVTPIEGAFVINIGDMMERWTNGLWKSTLHRVVHTGEKFRVSVPFFYEPAFTTTVRPFESCIEKTKLLANGAVTKGESVIYGRHLVGKVKGNFY